jgi:uncharacterized RDD family membrane protein YckC
MASMTKDVVQPQVSTHVPRQPHPAGFFSRFEAFVIDLVILSIVQLVSSAFIQTILRFFRLTGLIGRIQTLLDNTSLNIAIGSSVFALFVIGYFVFFWTLVGFTPGKAILGLKVMKMNGAKLSFGRSLLRFICYWVSAIPLFIGFLWVLWDPKRQAWHDKIAGTQVLYIPKKAHK